MSVASRDQFYQSLFVGTTEYPRTFLFGHQRLKMGSTVNEIKKMIRHVLMTARISSSEWAYSLELARALAGHGGRVSLCTVGGPLTKDQRREAARVPGLALYDSGLTLDWSHGQPPDLSAASQFLLTLEQRLRPDILHLNGFAFGPVHAACPIVTAVHSVHERIPIAGAATELFRFRKDLATLLEMSDLVILPTFAMLEELKRSYLLTAETRVIPYFRRTLDYAQAQKQKFVFSDGRISEDRRTMAAIEIAARELDWPVVTAVEQSSIKSESSRGFGLRAAVRISAAKVAEQMSKAAIYCLPTHDELSDVSVLEGALSRCAMVLEDSPNLRENWNHCAIFVPTGDDEFLKKSVQQLITDQDLREQLAGNAYERAKEFSPERCIDDYLDAMQTAVVIKGRQN